MSEVSSKEAVVQLVAILDEAFEKPPGEWHHFTDASPDSAYFGTLAKLTCADAGRSVAGSSVADQVSHAAFIMDTSTSLLRGGTVSPGLEQWQASWQTAELDEQAWEKLQQKLRGAYSRLRDAIQSHGVSNAEEFGAVVGTLVHLAYHLGAIKQKVAILDRAV